jgi:hypothetical protein
MTGPADPPWDPNNVLDPTSKFYVPEGYPRFKSPGPEEGIVDPVPPDGRMLCPQCGVVFKATLGRHKEGDYGVCGHCAMVRIRLLQRSAATPLPGP